MFNNQIEELPTQISSLQKLKHLNLGLVKSISSQFVLSFLTLPLLYFSPFVLSFICFVTFSFRLLSIILSSLLLLYLHLSLFFFSFFFNSSLVHVCSLLFLSLFVSRLSCRLISPHIFVMVFHSSPFPSSHLISSFLISSLLNLFHLLSHLISTFPPLCCFVSYCLFFCLLFFPLLSSLFISSFVSYLL